jgi:hypothetical protein
MHYSLPFSLRTHTLPEILYCIMYVHVRLYILFQMDTFSQKCKYVKYES